MAKGSQTAMASLFQPAHRARGTTKGNSTEIFTQAAKVLGMVGMAGVVSKPHPEPLEPTTQPIELGVTVPIPQAAVVRCTLRDTCSFLVHSSARRDFI